MPESLQSEFGYKCDHNLARDSSGHRPVPARPRERRRRIDRIVRPRELDLRHPRAARLPAAEPVRRVVRRRRDPALRIVDKHKRVISNAQLQSYNPSVHRA